MIWKKKKKWEHFCGSYRCFTGTRIIKRKKTHHVTTAIHWKYSRVREIRRKNNILRGLRLRFFVLEIPNVLYDFQLQFSRINIYTLYRKTWKLKKINFIWKVSFRHFSLLKTKDAEYNEDLMYVQMGLTIFFWFARSIIYRRNSQK